MKTSSAKTTSAPTPPSAGPREEKCFELRMWCRGLGFQGLFGLGVRGFNGCFGQQLGPCDHDEVVSFIKVCKGCGSQFVASLTVGLWALEFASLKGST